jgi:hypothetical protein
VDYFLTSPPDGGGSVVIPLEKVPIGWEDAKASLDAVEMKENLFSFWE